MVCSCCPKLLLLFAFTDVGYASWSETLPAKPCFLLLLPFIGIILLLYFKLCLSICFLRTHVTHHLLMLGCIVCEPCIFWRWGLEGTLSGGVSSNFSPSWTQGPLQVGAAAPHRLPPWLLCSVFVSGTIRFPFIPFYISSIFKITFIISHLEFLGICIRSVFSILYLLLFDKEFS